jgi:putative hydrolase of the HAD superfamily
VTEVGCVVFDIDDTLYLERDYVRSGFRCVGEWVGRNLGISGFSDLAWREFQGGARGSIFDLVLKHCGVDVTPTLISQLVDMYRRHEPKIELLPDALDCLNGLVGRLRLGIVTDGPSDSQRAKARALDLGQWFDPIIFTADLGADFSKPHPRAFETVEELVGCSGWECAYVADNPVKDFTAPKRMGWMTVRVRRPASLHHAANSNKQVDLEVPDLRDLGRLIDRLSAVP